MVSLLNENGLYIHLQLVMCSASMLFGAQQSTFRTGFCDWKNCQLRVVEHEKSADHTASVTVWMVRIISFSTGHIDSALVKHVQSERNYWREVLRRVVEAVKFLAERGLPFRGTDEKFGSETNGNYLGIMELIAKFDSFLGEHIIIIIIIMNFYSPVSNTRCHSIGHKMRIARIKIRVDSPGRWERA